MGKKRTFQNSNADLKPRPSPNSVEVNRLRRCVLDANARKTILPHQSVIYPDRYKENDNLRLPPNSLIDKMRTSGIDTLVVGHTPAGNIPVPLKKDGFLLIMGDTSYAPNGGAASITIENGLVGVRARTSAGTEVSYETSAHSKDIIGKLIDSYTIVGQTTGGAHIGYKYYDGFNLDEKKFNSDELAKAKPIAPIFPENLPPEVNQPDVKAQQAGCGHDNANLATALGKKL